MSFQSIWCLNLHVASHSIPEYAIKFVKKVPYLKTNLTGKSTSE